LAGNKNSGRQPEKYLTQDQVDALLEKAPLSTDAGRTTVMTRAVRMMLVGDLQARLFRELGEGLERMSRFGRQRTLDRRARTVRKAADDIKRARLAGRNLRDVGEPPDDIGKRSGDKTP
jgi:hypothetical protein